VAFQAGILVTLELINRLALKYSIREKERIYIIILIMAYISYSIKKVTIYLIYHTFFWSLWYMR
jgi:hypothetical protein